MKRWIVVDIGCIECGESSKVVGFYKTAAAAEEAWTAYSTKHVGKLRPKIGEYQPRQWGRNEWGGQHEVHIESVDI